MMQKLILREETLPGRAGEAYRELSSNLELCGSQRVLAVTGLTNGPVKTKAALYLAAQLAMEGYRALLVDADLNVPAMEEHLQSGEIAYGLADALAGRCEATECICETDRADLAVILNGPVVPAPERLLESVQFSQLLTVMRDRYDRIVVNAPLLKEDSLAVAACRLCDGTILTVPAGAVGIAKAQRLVDTLSEAGCDLLGCVLCE